MFDMQHNFDPLPFSKGGVNFNYLAGGIWKIRQKWKYSVGAAFLKKGGGVAKLCYAFEEKLFFSATIILWIKSF